MANITANDINLPFIQNYCINNNQKAWYNEQIKKSYPAKVHPKGADGKIDKSQPKIVEIRRISFIQLKINFIEAFFPELKPKKKEKKASMYDEL